MADFGICKIFEDKVDVASTIIGTPQYLAPEIDAGLAGGYDYRVDIWSLGCCLYEIVAGDPPFRGPQDAHVKDVDYRDYFSNSFKDLLEGLLQKKPENRLSLEQCKNHKFFKGVNW